MTQSAPPQGAVSVIAQEFIVDQPCAVAVEVPGALIHLRPGTAEDRVEVNVSVSGCSPEEAETILDRMQIGTHQMKDTVRVTSDADRSDAEWWRWIRSLDVDVHVELRLPERIEADLRVPGGEISVADLEGHIDLQVMGGACHVENVEGSLDLRAESSEISIENFSGNQVVARVAVGSLSLRNVDVEMLTLRSVAAPIQVRETNGATTITANGAEVDLHGLSGPCTVDAQGGSLLYEARPTEETSLSVVGSTLDARIPKDYSGELTMTGPSLTLDDAFSFEGDRKETVIDGTLNDGGPHLTLRAVAGSARCEAA